MSEPQAAETVVHTPKGPVELTARATRFLHELIKDDPRLAKTAHQLSLSEATIPDDEREAFCEVLGGLLGAKSPAELSEQTMQELVRLYQAVCV